MMKRLSLIIAVPLVALVLDGCGSSSPTRPEQEVSQARQYATGAVSGKELVIKEMSVTQGKSGAARLAALIAATEKYLAGLPLAAQKGAFLVIEAWVQEYQNQGQLPPTSLQEIKQTIRGKFPALKLPPGVR